MQANHVLALYFNLVFFNGFVKGSLTKAVSLSSFGASNLLSIFDKGGLL